MNLVIGSELINDDGHTVCVENILRESNHDGVEVFNFKVEDYHTYYVGESCILVHNADYDTELISKNIKSKVANDEIDPPTERGRAPKSKKNGYSIEIHHDEQNPNGPFKEMTRTDHRLGVNYKKKIIQIIRKNLKLIERNGNISKENIGKMNGIVEDGISSKIIIKGKVNRDENI